MASIILSLLYQKTTEELKSIKYLKLVFSVDPVTALICPDQQNIDVLHNNVILIFILYAILVIHTISLIYEKEYAICTSGRAVLNT